jgi:hypothetical protein
MWRASGASGSAGRGIDGLSGRDVVRSAWMLITTDVLSPTRAEADADTCLTSLPCLPLHQAEPMSPLRRALVWSGISGWDIRPAPPPAVADLIGRLPAGGWTIGRSCASALALLAEAVAPQRILEFGSGVSTVILAALCAARGGDGRVISVDESPAFAARTRRLLGRFGLAEQVTLITAPVGEQEIDGWQGTSYVLDADQMTTELAGSAVDFVFIDGPANWLRRCSDGRYGTLLTARRWIGASAVFAVDDALRRRDLATLRRWRALPFVDLAGVVPVGRGLGVGIVRGNGR